MKYFVPKKQWVAYWLVTVFCIFLSACAKEPAKHFKLSGLTMGTSYHITVVADADRLPGLTTSQLQQLIDSQLMLINQQMSTYLPDSELSRLNNEVNGEWASISPELFDILLLSVELGWLSNGSFDITIGPLVDLWGFGPEHQQVVPTDAQITQRLKGVGFQNIELNLADNKVLRRGGVRMDLSAIAKGYGVDVVAALLKSQGFNDFMVEIGGELYLSGHSPRGTPWRIAIEQPSGQLGGVHRAISVSNMAVATSGDYRNYYERDGKRYSHTIDPSTGRPITHTLASVTVIADTASRADGLATAINVMGAEKGLQLAKQQGLAVYLMSKSDTGFKSQYSDAFEAFLE